MHASITAEDKDCERPPVRLSFMLKVFIVFAGLAVLSAAISLVGKTAGRSIAMAGHTDATRPYEIVIGNDVLVVPANMIRFDASRRDGVAARLDLYLRWPQMDGYSDAARDDFNHADGRRHILFLSFEERMMSRDMSERLKPIYRAIIQDAGRPGPAGLTAYAFPATAGYVDEVLVVADEDSAVPFVMRCLSGETARQSLAPCERDIHIGEGLTLTYRMPVGLVGSWRQVEAAVREVAGRFLQTGDGN